MTIRVIYTSEPAFPASDQHPDALRIQLNGFWVDYIGTAPTLAEVQAVISPPVATVDGDALNAALAAPGSVVRALGLVMFAEINKLRVKNGDAAYTLNQFKAALLAQMR